MPQLYLSQSSVHHLLFLPGSPTFGLKITSNVALSIISLLIFTSAGPYAAAINCVDPTVSGCDRLKLLVLLTKKKRIINP